MISVEQAIELIKAKRKELRIAIKLEKIKEDFEEVEEPNEIYDRFDYKLNLKLHEFIRYRVVPYIDKYDLSKFMYNLEMSCVPTTYKDNETNISAGYLYREISSQFARI